MRAKEFISESINKDVISMQRELKAAGADLGSYGPAKDGVDGRMGAKTQAAMQRFPDIAGKYKSAVARVPQASDAEVAQDDHSVRVGQNPNIDNDTRDRAQASVKNIMPVDGRVTSPFGSRHSPTAGAR
jgi:peptidoglycan hydrolase-like protein with peptidoglycan-binding domain